MNDKSGQHVQPAIIPVLKVDSAKQVAEQVSSHRTSDGEEGGIVFIQEEGGLGESNQSMIIDAKKFDAAKKGDGKSTEREDMMDETLPVSSKRGDETKRVDSEMPDEVQSEEQKGSNEGKQHDRKTSTVPTENMTTGRGALTQPDILVEGLDSSARERPEEAKDKA